PSPGDAADQFGFVSDPGGEQGDEIARELEPLLFGRKPACGLIEERFQKRDVLGGQVGTGKNLAQRHGFLLFGAKARSSLTAASALYTAGDETPSVTISRMASHFMFQGYLEEPISGRCEGGLAIATVRAYMGVIDLGDELLFARQRSRVSFQFRRLR